jgi:hypothetical protein
MYIGCYLDLLARTEADLATAFDAVASNHTDEHDVSTTCTKLADQSREQSARLRPFADRYDGGSDSVTRQPQRPERRPSAAALQLLDDLHDLYTLASEVKIVATIAHQAAQMLRDGELVDALAASCDTATRQLAWLTTRIKQSAPQTLIAVSPTPLERRRDCCGLR